VFAPIYQIMAAGVTKGRDATIPPTQTLELPPSREIISARNEGPIQEKPRSFKRFLMIEIRFIRFRSEMGCSEAVVRASLPNDVLLQLEPMR